MTSVGPYTQSTVFNFLEEEEKRKKSIPCDTIMGLILNNPEFSTFLALVKRAKMERVLIADDNLTLFIPSDSSMKNLIDMKYVEIDTAINIVKMHIIKGYYGSDVLQGTNADFKTQTGNKLHVSTNEQKITTINVDVSPMGYVPKKIEVLYFNIQLRNGLVHVTNGLLLT